MTVILTLTWRSIILCTILISYVHGLFMVYWLCFDELEFKHLLMPGKILHWTQIAGVLVWKASLHHGCHKCRMSPRTLGYDSWNVLSDNKISPLIILGALCYNLVCCALCLKFNLLAKQASFLQYTRPYTIRPRSKHVTSLAESCDLGGSDFWVCGQNRFKCDPLNESFWWVLSHGAICFPYYVN